MISDNNSISILFSVDLLDDLFVQQHLFLGHLVHRVLTLHSSTFQAYTVDKLRVVELTRQFKVLSIRIVSKLNR